MNRETAIQTLGLKPDFKKEDVAKAFRALVRQHHPDVGGSREKFEQIREAKQVLEAKPTNKSEAKRNQLLRDLRIVTGRLAIVNARVLLWDEWDYRIKQMKEPLEQERDEIVKQLNAMA
jgi:curved DNA-binding protein CbpA